MPPKKLVSLRRFIKSTLKIGIITGRALETLCGKIMHSQPSIHVVGTSDACNEGAGFCINKTWALYKFKQTHKNKLHIDEKEAHAVIMLLHNLRKELTGKKLILMIDNSELYHAMRRHWAGERMMLSIYEICFVMMECKIQVWFELIPSSCNKLADSLSRFDLNTFWKWVGINQITVNPTPKTLTYINKFKMITI